MCSFIELLLLFELSNKCVFWTRMWAPAWGFLKPQVHRTFVTPPPPKKQKKQTNFIFVWSNDHIFFLQNIKPRSVLISINQTKTGNKQFFKKVTSLHTYTFKEVGKSILRKPTSPGKTLLKKIIYNRIICFY